MKLQEKFDTVISYFNNINKNPLPELRYKSPYQLAVAVILSAQCTDKRVNKITPHFFKTFPDPQTLAQASTDEIYQIIKSCSYPNNKAKNILGMAKMLVERFNGKFPDDPEKMQELPGIGRKSAHVLASVLYKKPTLAVDTHVFRVSARLGLTRGARNPFQCETQLMRYIKPAIVYRFHHWLILHGRYVCKARKPECHTCGLTNLCTFYKKNKRTNR